MLALLELYVINQKMGRRYALFIVLFLCRFSRRLSFQNTILLLIVPMGIDVTLWMLLSEGVGGRSEENNHGDADFSPSQELDKLVNGNNKV